MRGIKSQLLLLSIVFTAGSLFVYVPKVAANQLSSFSSLSAQADAHSGSANMGVPIEVPSGRGGIQPNISLSYNSSSPDGLFGVGWNMELGSVIRSGKQGVPEYDTSDTFILLQSGGAQELVKGTGDQYHAKIESAFMKIEFVSGTHWVVTDQKGITYTFGENSSARVFDPSDTTHVYQWKLEKVEDVHGNYMTFTYYAHGNMLYPDRVDYTGNGVEGPFAYVEFLREALPYTGVKRYYAGFEMRQDERINEIKVYAQSQLQRRYALHYEQSPVTNRSLLTSVELFDKDNLQSMPPMKFTYQTKEKDGEPEYALNDFDQGAAEGDKRFNVRFGGTRGQHDNNFVIYPGDSFYNWTDPCHETQCSASGISLSQTQDNGNFTVTGNTDTSFHAWAFVYVPTNQNVDLSVSTTNTPLVKVFINNTGPFDPGTHTLEGGKYNLIQYTGYHEHSNYTVNFNKALINQTNVQSVSSVSLFQGKISGDFNGDGLTDIARYDESAGTIDVSISSGGGAFEPAVEWMSGIDQSDKFVLGDFNGDRKTDICLKPTNGQVWWVYASNGTSAFVNTGSSWISNFGNGDEPGAGDFNGDGVTDIYIFTGDVTGRAFHVALSDKTKFTYWDGTNIPISVVSSETFISDFNGDGQMDIGAFDKPNGNWEIFIGDGGADDLGFITETAPSSFGANEKMVIADFNYDGMTDIGYYDESNKKVIYRVSEGDDFSTLEEELPFTFSISGTNTQVQSGDYNGDTLIDFVATNPGDIEIAYSNGRTADIMSMVDNGVGGLTNITYISANKSENADLPFPIQVVQCVGKSNRLGAEYKTFHYYQGAKWDFDNNEFLGFETVKMTDIDGNYTQSTYHQDELKKGRILKQETYDSTDTLFSETSYTWDDQDLGNGSTFIYLKRKDSKVIGHDSGSTEFPGHRTAEEYFYAQTPQYGHLTKTVQLGEVDFTNGNDIGQDKRTVETSYVHNTTDYILGLPQEVKILDNSDTEVRKTWFSYDNGANGDTPTEGLLTEKVDWHSGTISNALNPKTQYVYDSYGNLKETIDPKGNATKITYDSTCHLFPILTENAATHQVKNEYYGINETVETGYQGLWGQLKSTTDPNDQKGRRSYDSFGRLSKTVGPLDTIDYPTTEVSYTFITPYTEVVTKQRVNHQKTQTLEQTAYYDGLGRLVFNTSPSANANKVYVTGQTEYNEKGLPIVKYIPRETDNPFAQVTTTTHAHTLIEYDAMGRVLTTRQPWDPNDASNRPYSSVEYDGWMTSTINENGHKQSSIFDAYGRLEKKIEYTGADGRADPTYPQANFATYATTEYTYDSEGNLTQTKDAANNITTIGYNNLGQKTSMNDPDMGNWTYTYDLNGNLEKQTDAKGTEITFSYDVLNRLTNKTDGTSNLDVDYTYDDDTNGEAFTKGRLTQARYGGIADATEFSYDSLGREVTSSKVIDSNTFDVQRSYDALNRLVKVRYPDQDRVHYKYNQVGQIIAVSNDRSLLPADSPPNPGGSSIDPDLKLLLKFDGTNSGDVSLNHTVEYQGHAAINPYGSPYNSGSLQLDGSGDDMKIIDGSNMAIAASTTDDWTMDLQVKHTDTSVAQTYLSHYEDALNYWEVGYDPSLGVYFHLVKVGDKIIKLEAGSLTVDDWHHIAVIKKGDDFGLYVDGDQIDYDVLEETLTLTGDAFAGSFAGMNKYLKGELFGVRVKKEDIFTAAPSVNETLSPGATFNHVGNVSLEDEVGGYGSPELQGGNYTQGNGYGAQCTSSGSTCNASFELQWDYGSGLGAVKTMQYFYYGNSDTSSDTHFEIYFYNQEDGWVLAHEEPNGTLTKTTGGLQYGVQERNETNGTQGWRNVEKVKFVFTGSTSQGNVDFELTYLDFQVYDWVSYDYPDDITVPQGDSDYQLSWLQDDQEVMLVHLRTKNLDSVLNNNRTKGLLAYTCSNSPRSASCGTARVYANKPLHRQTDNKWVSVLSWIEEKVFGVSSAEAQVTSVEFVSEINKVGEDYATIQDWENAMDDALDLTVSTVKVFSHGGITGSIADGATVTGNTSSASATVVHATSTQILLRSISGTFSNGEQVQVDASNHITLSDAGNSASVALAVYDDQGVIEEEVTISGLTTSATNYIRIYAPTGERHDGTVGTGARITTTNDGGAVFYIDGTAHTKFEGLAIGMNVNGFLQNAVGIHQSDWDAGTLWAIDNLFYKTDAGNGSYNTISGIKLYYQTTTDLYAVNNIFYDLDADSGGGRGIRASNYGGGNFYIYNNTFYSMNRFGVDVQKGTGYLKNNVAVDNTTDYNVGSYADASSTHNLSSDTTAPALNTYYHSTSVSFVDAANGDLHTIDPDVVDEGTDLSSDTHYSFSSDIDGQTRSGSWDLGADETPASGDTEAPSVPSGLSSPSKTDTTVALSWNASMDNVGVVGYVVYRGGSSVATPTGTSYTDTGLTASTAYEYKVSAKDAAGNESELSSALNVTTDAPPDTEAPTQPTGLIATGKTSTSVSLSWSASTDNVGVTGYKVYRDGANVGTPSGTTYSDTGLTAATTYQYEISAVDAAGNESTKSVAINETTDAQAASGPTEFISKICAVGPNCTDEDYNLLSTWEDAMDEAGDLTAGDIKVFTHGGVTGSITDGASVTGVTSSATGTVIHATATQVLVDAISGTFQNGETLQVDASNYVVLSDEGNSPIIVAEVYDDDGAIDDYLVIDGFTTSSDNYIKVTVPSGERHNGTASSGAKITTGEGLKSTIYVKEQYTVVEWLVIENRGGTYRYAFENDKSAVFQNNIVTEAHLDCVKAHSDLDAYNNVLMNCGQDGIDAYCQYNDYHLYNNTIYNAASKGIKIDYSNGDCQAMNNVVVDSGSADYEGVSNFSNFSHNASSDTTATGTGAVTGITSSVFVSTTAGSEDLHLVAGATQLLDVGVDISGSLTVDIDGDLRLGSWDLGADDKETGVNQVPVANAQLNIPVMENGTLLITLTGSDGDQNPLTYSIIDHPDHGVLSGTPPNVTYTPQTDYYGSDSFLFTVSDGLSSSPGATVSIDVENTNVAPVALSQSGLEVDEGDGLSIVLKATDPDPEPLTFTITDQPDHGTLLGEAPYVVYVPDEGYTGTDSFSFKVNDTFVDSASDGVISLEVIAETVQNPLLYVEDVEYNALGQVTKIEYGNGVTTEREYNQFNLRLERIHTYDSSQVTLQDLRYTYDPAGNILSIDDQSPNGTNDQTFEYDEQNRLTKATNNNTGQYGVKDYVYNEIGNITEKDGKTYTYGEGGAGPHAVTKTEVGSDWTAYTYDANGNMETKQVSGDDFLRRFSYDVENRLTKVTEEYLSDGSLKDTIADYEYDGDGGRTKKIVDGVTTEFVGSLYEKTGSRTTSYIFLGDQKVATVHETGGTETFTFMHMDHLGGTNVVTDNTGGLKELIEYQPYGKIERHDKWGDPEEVARHYFTGHYHDNETGLIYMQARYYDPDLGRFITPDTIVQAGNNPQTLNRYSYAGNNPVNRIDPSGHSFWKSFLRSFVGGVLRAIGSFFLGPVIGGAIAGAATAAIFGGSGRDIGIGAGLGAASGLLFGSNGSDGLLGAAGPGVGLAILIGGGIHSYQEGGGEGATSYAGGVAGGILGTIAGNKITSTFPSGDGTEQKTKSDKQTSKQQIEKAVKEGRVETHQVIMQGNNARGDSIEIQAFMMTVVTKSVSITSQVIKAQIHTLEGKPITYSRYLTVVKYSNTASMLQGLSVALGSLKYLEILEAAGMQQIPTQSYGYAAIAFHTGVMAGKVAFTGFGFFGGTLLTGNPFVGAGTAVVAGGIASHYLDAWEKSVFQDIGIQ